jgi:hypothetical protein
VTTLLRARLDRRGVGAEQAREGCVLAQRRERLDQPKRAWLGVSRSTLLRSIECEKRRFTALLDSNV